TGNRPGGFWGRAGQSFKQTDDNTKFRLPGENGWIQRFRLGVVDDGHIGRRLLTDTAQKKGPDHDAKSKTRPRKNPPGALEIGHCVISIAPAPPGHWWARTGARTANCWSGSPPAGRRAASLVAGRKPAFAFVFVPTAFQIPPRCCSCATGPACSRETGPS